MAKKFRRHLLAASEKSRSMAAASKLDEVGVTERSDQLLSPSGRSVGIEFSGED